MPSRRERSPAPPANLLSRCLATVPVGATPAGPRLRPDAPSRRRLIAFGVAAGTCVSACVGMPLLRGWLTPGSAGLVAPAVDGATKPPKRVTFYRRESRQLPFWVDKAGTVVFASRWQRIVTVYAEDAGRYDVYDQSGGSHTLQLPDGTYLTRLGDLTRKYKYPAVYFRTELREAEGIGAPVRKIRRDTQQFTTPCLERGVVYHGRRTDRLSFEERVGRLHGVKNAPVVRQEWYTDPQTGRVFATRQFAFWRSGPRAAEGERLIGEAQYEYTPRPGDLGLLDQRRFVRGSKVKRG